MWVLSINTLIFEGHGLRTALEEIARLGVRRVEPAFIKAYAPDLTEAFFTEEQGQQIHGWLGGLDLQAPAVSAHMDLGGGDGVEAFSRRMLFAKAMGARFVISNATSRSREAMFLKNIDRLARFARSLALTICLENPGDGDDHLIDSARAGAQLIEEIGSEQVRLNYDVGNLFINSRGALSPSEDFPHALSCSAHFHLKDIRQDANGYSYCAIGGGVVDYGPILDVLAEQADEVPIGIEIPLRLRRGDDWVPWIDAAVPELSEIRRTLQASLDFIAAHRR